MANLVDNAIRHNLAGGWVEVRAIATAHAASVEATPRPAGGLTVTITFRPGRTE